ncbi:MAG: hypothetical protein U1D97_15115 [Desulfuromonadales bacterium]|nr:hypothetical protein [Desulfuromonadales bacterium]
MKSKNTFTIIAILSLTLLVVWPASLAYAVLLCGTPGATGNGFPNGVINDYWPGSGSPSAGNSSLTLGARRAGSAGNSIVAGDLVLIIQMQDADINSTNTANYGANAGTGSGATNIQSAGLYEYVLATNTVTAAGGTLSFTPALTNSYRTRNYAASSNGQSRWQAVRVPQYGNATTTGAVTTPAWDGTTGGIVAMDVENTLDLSANPSVNVAGRGFRGGAGRTLGGATGFLNSDFRTMSTSTTNASKGEGIAGRPRYLNNTATYNAAPTVLDTNASNGEGYPNGSYARGAPGNAGGGGTDGRPTANDENTGGGGGSNYGYGGQGGNSWNSNVASGGRGGASFSSLLAFNRIFLGGGGGAGTTNDGTADPATYASPPGVSCSAGAGACSSGAAGGGIVLIRAGSITGSGLIDARGADGYNVQNDGAGGGGGGGSVVLQSYFNGNATVNVSGGNGGNAWRERTVPAIDRHGPGGGGGGGFIAYSPSTGFNVTAAYNAGLPGLSSGGDTFGSTSGNGGITTYDLPNVPGIQPGTFCPPAIKGATLAIDNGVPGKVDPGDTIEYTVVYRNGSSGAISGFNITDTLPAGIDYVGGSLSISTAGGAIGSANSAYDGSASTTLLASNITIPAGGIVTARIRAEANAPVCSNVYNQANSVQSSGADILGLTDNADSTQNEGGLPSGTYILQSPYGTSGSTDRTGFTMGCPNLITSTKSWVDLNGGDPEPGDVLRYTITITDSGGGNVSGVTVTDDIPADVNAITAASIISLPPGATNSSTYSGTGSNLNGYLNITNISVPAAGSVTVVFDVTINSGATNGTVINNSAVVTNPLGPGGTPTAPPVTVVDSFAPINGIKRLYLYPNSNTAGNLSRTVQTNGTSYYINRGNGTGYYMQLTLNPALSAAFNVDGDIGIRLCMRRTTDGSGSKTVRVELLDNATAIGTNGEVTWNANGWGWRTFTIPNSGTTTLDPGDPLRLRISNRGNNSTSTSNRVDLDPDGSSCGSTNPPSYVEINSSTVINVDSIEYYNAPWPGGSIITSATLGSPLSIRATVSDPFGYADIFSAAITLIDPSGTTIGPLSMTELAGASGALKRYEFLIDPVPLNTLSGNWTVRVDAVEGTEGTVSDFGNKALLVPAPMPSLLVVKSSQVYSDPINGTTAPKAIPGAFVNYTILVTNTGPGPVDNNTTVITDPIPANTELFVGDFDGAGPGLGPILFTNGATASGLSYTFTNLASTTDNLAFSGNNGSDYDKSNTTPDSNECDSTVTNIKIPLNGIFNGSDGTNHPSFNVKFRVRIK